MDTEAMLERARRVMADERNQVQLGAWAEALLAVEAARVEAVRERDENQEAGLDLAGQLVAAEARAEQAERRWADLKAGRDALERLMSVALTDAKERVAALEGALREALRVIDSTHAIAYGADVGTAPHHGEILRGEGYCYACEAHARFRAALGDQEAPTEPLTRAEAFAMDAEGYDVPVSSCKACGLRQVNGLVGPCIDHGANPRPWDAAAPAPAAPQVAPTELTDAEVVEFHMTHDGAAPQVAPEPERSPHASETWCIVRPAPLVEGEQDG